MIVRVNNNRIEVKIGEQWIKCRWMRHADDQCDAIWYVPEQFYPSSFCPLCGKAMTKIKVEKETL